MLATLAGFLALLLGLALLLLPLLVTELSRPRDSAWGAVVLLLGLVLVTSAERLTGAPMLAVLCGGLLVGRLGGEVAQGRWRALTEEERQALRSAERWSRSLHQLAAVAGNLLQSGVGAAAGVSAWLAERRQARTPGKRWVRSEVPPVATATQGAGADTCGSPAGESAQLPAAAADDSASVPVPGDPDAEAPEGLSVGEPRTDGEGGRSSTEREPQTAAAAVPASRPAGEEVKVVSDFDGVDALLAAAPEPVSPSQPSEARAEAGDPPSEAQAEA